jgi:DNA-binding MarR family transcriptional regulator
MLGRPDPADHRSTLSEGRARSLRTKQPEAQNCAGDESRCGAQERQLALKSHSLHNRCYMQQSLVSPKQDHLVDAVLSASRVLVAIAARSLADVGEAVTLTQYRSLVVLASRGPQGVAALAEAVSVTPPTASRMCDRLVKKGLVTRRTDRSDRRQVRIALSPDGRRLVDTVTTRRRIEIEQLVATIPAESRGGVVDALRHLSDTAGEVPEQDWSTGWDL